MSDRYGRKDAERAVERLAQSIGVDYTEHSVSAYRVRSDAGLEVAVADEREAASVLLAALAHGATVAVCEPVR